VATDADAAEARAQALLALGRPAQAEAVLRQALAAEPDSARLLALLSRAFLAQKRFQDASAQAGAALASDPENFDGLSCLAGALSGMHQYEPALNAVRRAAAVEPMNPCHSPPGGPHLYRGGQAHRGRTRGPQGQRSRARECRRCRRTRGVPVPRRPVRQGCRPGRRNAAAGSGEPRRARHRRAGQPARRRSTGVDPALPGSTAPGSHRRAREGTPGDRAQSA
jgi:tetratricopeptide (TPR) repeat protein